MTHNKSFGSELTAINELHRRIYYILDEIFILFYQCLSDLRIEALAGYENMTRYGNIPKYGNIPEYVRPGENLYNFMKKSRIWKLYTVWKLYSIWKFHRIWKLNIIQYIIQPTIEGKIYVVGHINYTLMNFINRC